MENIRHVVTSLLLAHLHLLVFQSVGSHNNNPDNSSMDDPQGWIRDITSSGEVFFTHPVTEEKVMMELRVILFLD